MSGRVFDVQVVHTPPESSRGQLLQQYVLARVMSMQDINLDLYDYDRHNALYFFAVNAEEQIYFRYGGRDSEAPDTYLNLDSLELALKAGLQQHDLYREGKRVGTAPPAPRYPRDIPGIQKFVLDRGRCVECHHLAHFESMELERSGELDKLRHMYRSPDIKKLGIHLDIPQGLRIAEAKGAALKAGLATGDVILEIESEPVITFGDFQYRLDKVDRRATTLSIAVERKGEKKEIEIQLPDLWFVTDLEHRFWTIEPRLYFEADPLSVDEKKSLGFPDDGFASRVTEVPFEAMLEQANELEKGDIIYSVDGVERDDVAKDAALYVKLTCRSGDTVTLGVLRGDERIELPLNTKRKSFRRLD
ncbi:MAG: hypothetical protein CMO55_07230 [Verrucomicrobiales bacterium]|nr:hypothetical protein [Verrucomicrobiales bacterium]